eukprot:9907125-Lingulodinium_polyedra.AAC.1
MVLSNAKACVIGDEDPDPHPARGNDLSQLSNPVHNNLRARGQVGEERIAGSEPPLPDVGA